MYLFSVHVYSQDYAARIINVQSITRVCTPALANPLLVRHLQPGKLFRASDSTNTTSSTHIPETTHYRRHWYLTAFEPHISLASSEHERARSPNDTYSTRTHIAIMPSQRRMKFFGILIVTTIVVLFYMSRAAHQTQSSDFYTKTQQALQEKEYAEAAKQRDAESVGSRLKAAEDQAKKNAENKYADHKVQVEGQDQKSVAGRVKMDGDKVPGVAQQGGRPHDQAAMKENETLEDHEVEMELNAILKKSPSTLLLHYPCPTRSH